jgi:hypothetical protein
VDQLGEQAPERLLMGRTDNQCAIQSISKDIAHTTWAPPHLGSLFPRENRVRGSCPEIAGTGGPGVRSPALSRGGGQDGGGGGAAAAMPAAARAAMTAAARAAAMSAGRWSTSGWAGAHGGADLRPAPSKM